MSGDTAYPAPAKLNLFLRVTGRRADGYHLLQTLYRLIDFGDGVEFSLRDDGRIARVNVVAGVAEDDDLTVRAARLLQRAARATAGADITLHKRLPLGGGLGGGSSDAATALIVLNRLWRVGWSRERLCELALELGADVPAFVFGRSALGEGVGEKLQPVDLPPAWYVVLTPPVAVSTARVFASPELTRNSIPIKIQPFLVGPGSAERGSIAQGQGPLGHNDLEPVVCREHPEVARHLDWLKRHGAAAMTGSGACVFCGFPTEREARDVFAQLPADMRGFVARGLDRHPLWEMTA